MICECVHCRMKFAVAIVCLLMLNILVSVSGNCLLSYTLFTRSVSSVHAVQFRSVTEFVSRSIIIKIMTAALTRSSYVETFQFSASQRTARVSVMSSGFPAADYSTIMDKPSRYSVSFPFLHLHSIHYPPRNGQCSRSVSVVV